MLYSSDIQPMDANSDDLLLLNLLRARDEAAFSQLVEQYHAALVRLARIFVHSTTIAEEVAQDTWLAVLDGLEKFEGRSSLKTWIFTILANKARTIGEREGRTISYSDVGESPEEQSTVDPARFADASRNESVGAWAAGAAPHSWAGIPEDSFLSQETLSLIQRSIDGLPNRQRLVILLRDVDEMSSKEICNILGISETHQRVLLHRARARVRQALEAYLQAE
jgi:RNA polymerase sigma-70 factor (ECF subfamily)